MEEGHVKKSLALSGKWFIGVAIAKTVLNTVELKIMGKDVDQIHAGKSKSLI